jgi:hypothetical protein
MELIKPKGFIRKLVYELSSANFFVELKKLSDNELELKMQNGFIPDMKGTFRMRFVIRMSGNITADAYWMFYDEKDDLATLGDDAELMAKDLSRRIRNRIKAE